MTNSQDDNFEFCPKCGKILLKSKTTIRCPKCGKIEQKSIQQRYPEDTSKKIKTKAQINTSNKKQRYGEFHEVSHHFHPPQSASIEDWQKFFPYLNIRPQQEQIIKTIIEGGKKRDHVIIQAANGVGKTISMLSALLPISINKQKTIVYCCRTHEQMSRVITELKMIRQLSPVAGISLRGRKELCLHPLIQKFSLDARNAADICRYLKKEGKCKYFSNIGNKQVMKKVQSKLGDNILDSEDLLDIGGAYQVCPFELSKRLIPSCNVIAASYQYIFNPNIRPTFLNNLDKALSDIILIVDEAHNLPSTAVDISSNSLSAYTIENALNEAGKESQGFLYDFLEAFGEVLKNETTMLKLNEEFAYDPKIFLNKVEKRAKLKIKQEIVIALERLGDVIKESKMKRNKTPTSSSSAVSRFLDQLLESKNKNEFAHFLSVTESQSGMKTPRLTTLSLDPRSITQEVFDYINFSVSASGTLEPLNAYISLTGLKEERTTQLVLPSPYDRDNILPLVVQSVSTKLKFRTPENFKTMVKIIDKVVNATPKNVGIFCTSYRILENLLDNGLERVVSKPLYIAHSGMSSRDNDELVRGFKNEAKNAGGILLSVLGGRSSEGSDYPGELMNTVIIVGIPFARPSPTIDASIEYLESQFPKKGREYGYNIPALIRASQAAGRPIRSLDDYAVILMLDYRFGQAYYRKHLPRWIAQSLRIVQPDEQEIYSKVKEFFDYHK